MEKQNGPRPQSPLNIYNFSTLSIKFFFTAFFPFSFIFLLGLHVDYYIAILMFRIFRNKNKLVVKILHMSMQILAITCGAIGLKAVFDHHTVDKTPHMYSMHSWIGFPTFIMFCLQVSV